jgi:ferredoxin
MKWRVKEGFVSVQTDLCDFCGTCVGVCPADAIELKESSILIKSVRCTLCGFCESICPLGIMEVAR